MIPIGVIGARIRFWPIGSCCHGQPRSPPSTRGIVAPRRRSTRTEVWAAVKACALTVTRLGTMVLTHSGHVGSRGQRVGAEYLLVRPDVCDQVRALRISCSERLRQPRAGASGPPYGEVERGPLPGLRWTGDGAVRTGPEWPVRSREGADTDRRFQLAAGPPGGAAYHGPAIAVRGPVSSGSSLMASQR
jgi:hypothetical protein